jgi:hypothetical protein
MTDDVGVRLLQEKLDAVEKEIATKVGNLVDTRDNLKASIKRLTRGSGGSDSSPAVPDEVLLKAIEELGGSAKSADIAEHLGVDTRKISRRLTRLIGEDKLAGNKDAGYSLA